MKLYSWQFFWFQIILSCKTMFEFLKFKIQIYKRPRMEKLPKQKCRSQKLWNFIVDNFFIWIHLEPQTSNTLSLL